MEEWLYQYIPHSKAEEYRQRGWEIHPLLGSHGVWSKLAVRRISLMEDRDYKSCEEVRAEIRSEDRFLMLLGAMAVMGLIVFGLLLFWR